MSVCVFQNVYIFLHIAQSAKIYKTYLFWSNRGHKKVFVTPFLKKYTIYASLYSQGTLKRFFFEWVREGIVFSLVAHVSSVAKPGSDQRKKIHFTLTYITRQCTMYLGLLPCKNNQVIFFSHQILSTTLHCGKCLWHF